MGFDKPLPPTPCPPDLPARRSSRSDVYPQSWPTNEEIAELKRSSLTDEEIAGYKRDEGISSSLSYTQYTTSAPVYSPTPSSAHQSPSLPLSSSLSTPTYQPNTHPTPSIPTSRSTTTTSTSEPDEEPAVEAAAEAEEDGTIGISIQVRHNSRYVRNLSAFGIKNAEGKMWDPLHPWGFVKAEWVGEPGDDDEKKRKGILAFSSNTVIEEGIDDLTMIGDDVEEGKVSDDKKGKGKGKWKKDKAEYKAALKARLTEDDVLSPMSIVIFIVGSRGDVQPYISLALSLIIHAGHRVRIATHPDFENFVLTANTRLRGKKHNGVDLEGRLEFFSAGGDPKELMAYMVKNPGLLPGFESLTNGDIKRKRDMAAEYLRGFYQSTFTPDVVSGREFAADAIISNPPAFAHVHVAEALGIPLLMSFTMPWTATTAFPHPLVNVKKSNADQWATNWMGYHLADVLMWEGLSTVINDFRTSILRLPVLSSRVASSVLDNLRIPWTYCWSPDLLPKPKDWKSHIDISGFYFLDSEDGFIPPSDLAEFLGRGEAPVYIGFGSVVIPDPEKVTDIIFEAVKNAGVRAIVSAGWAGLGKGREESYPNIFILDKDCSHEWLFADKRVAAVCHHGGAGTTSCGLRHGRPTIIVPFFGDQKFWGDAVHNAGAGPAPIPIKTLSVSTLTTALQFAISPEAVVAAGVLGEKIRAEKGEERGVRSFTRNMPLRDLCCDIDPRHTAVWWCERYSLRFSVQAAAALISAQKIDFKDLTPYRSKEYDVNQHNDGPIIATGGAISHTVTKTFRATSQLFYNPVKGTINVFYGIPEAALGVVADMYDGFDNVPKMMGSTPRIKGKVTDWKSGFKEGGKAFSLGLWDGIVGLGVEPVDGAMREGWTGLGKGFGRGVANMIYRPLAGSLGLFVLPTRGIRASVRASMGHNLDPHSVLRGPREALTREAMTNISEDIVERYCDTFDLLESETKKRKGKRDRTQWVLMANKEERRSEKLERERIGLERIERKEVDRRVKEEKRRVREKGLTEGKGKGKGKEKEKEVEEEEDKQGMEEEEGN